MSLRIGYAAGAFDLFHVGHLNILRQARMRCDYLIAGVVSDEQLLIRKGHLPVVPLGERLAVVEAIKYVDEVHPEILPNKIDTWRGCHFDIFFKGDDWRGSPAGLDLERQFAEVGVAVEYFPYTLHTSSTILRRTLNKINSTAKSAEATLGAQV